MKYRYREPHEMKDSGVEWLGMIPKEWNRKAIKNIVKVQSSKRIFENEYTDNGIPFYRSKEIGELSRGIKTISEMYISEKRFEEIKQKYGVPKKGDILITSIGSIGNTWLSDGRTFYYKDGNLTQIKNNKHQSMKFINYCFNSNFFKQQYKLMSAGSTLMALSIEKINQLIILNPKLIEQQKIVDFLDQKTAKFDEVIEKKEKLIEKLEEAKKSLISEVVTGKKKIFRTPPSPSSNQEGVNSEWKVVNREAHEMKDSGVEWLGIIPEEWMVKKAKYIFEIRKRISGELGYEILSITQKGIKKKDTTTGGGQLSMDYSKYQIVKPGDFAMNHMDLLTGYVDVSKFLGVTSPDYRVFSLRDKNNYSPYFLMLLQLGYKNKIFFGHGQGSSQLGRWRFPTEAFNNFKYPYPNYEEQKIIADFFFSKTKEINKVINQNQNQIERLKEAKQSLISEAVTGKIEIL